MSNYNSNSGYVGKSRSVNSQRAIESYEVPMNTITRTTIDNFLNENTSGLNEVDKDFLRKLPCTVWKFCASEKVGSSSYHHTGRHYNKTNHYDIYLIMEYLIENKDSIVMEYKQWQEEMKRIKEEQATDFSFGIMEIKVWGGTQRRPKLLGVDKRIGIIKDEWFYYKPERNCSSKTRKNNIFGRNVVSYKEFKCYPDLVKSTPEFKNTKKVFNSIIKDLPQ